MLGEFPLKKIISLILCIAVVLSLCAMPASAEGFSYEFEHTSESLYMVNLDTGNTVYSMNAHEKRPIASLTKIMTYIIAYENIPDLENTIITVDEQIQAELEGTGSSLAGVLVGEQLTALQLLYMMMIPSGNDAALTLAHYVDSQLSQSSSGTESTGTSENSSTETSAEESNNSSEAGNSGTGEDSAPTGNQDANTGEDNSSTETANAEDSSAGLSALPESTGSPFVDLMNKKARELGCSDTHFMNPHGLHDPNHYSTAGDMAKIAMYATTLPYFTEITSSTEYTLPPTNMCDEPRTVYTTNMMLTQVDERYHYTYATGIKTGSLNESGYCIAASAQYKGYSYIVVALGSPYIDENGEETDYHGEMVDAGNLFRWAFTQLEMKTVAAKGDLLGDVALSYAWDKDTLQVVAADNVAALLPTDVSVSSIIVTTDLPQKVQAPVKKGDKLGVANFSYAGEIVATVDLVASESVERSQIVQTVETSQEVVTSPWFLVIAGAIAIVLFFYIVIIIIYHNKKKKMRRVKRRRNL